MDRSEGDGMKRMSGATISDPRGSRSPMTRRETGKGKKTIPRWLRRQLGVCASFPQLVLFLDIETTGLSHYYDEITVVGWSFEGTAKTIIKGQDPAPLHEDASRAKALVTFNGVRFDTKFIRKEYPEVVFPETHVDLMYLCRRVGLTGGQKAIEKEIGVDLRDELPEMDGAEAVLLWHKYVRGERNALHKLIHYNRIDIAAMGAIFDEAASRIGGQSDMFVESTNFVDWSAPSGWRNLPKVSPPPVALTAKRLHFKDLFDDAFADLRVVGIDLTGAEERPSGWCLLHGREACVALVSSDEDLIEETSRARPHIVSIDSPLCLPAGRISVEDDDPGRAEFGIMRESERVLKRRGVNVYPCLIQSMQKLTARGMRLARALRERGIPVIESYPGAAQDIMRIPRKGAGEEWLRAGLQEFGITGAFETQKVTHDELDAITSALVGTFHMAGMSEALGTEEEPPLIIPRLEREPTAVVVGVSGPIAAGKTTLAGILERKGFSYTRFSLVLDDMLMGKNCPLTRSNRQTLGEEINASGRQRWLNEQTIKLAGAAERIVVDGLRFPDDHAFMVERFGARFFHAYIDAPEETRRMRFELRDGDVCFDKTSNAEVERRVDELRSSAHDVFVNDGDMPDIERYAGHIQDKGTGPCLFRS